MRRTREKEELKAWGSANDSLMRIVLLSTEVEVVIEENGELVEIHESDTEGLKRVTGGNIFAVCGVENDEFYEGCPGHTADGRPYLETLVGWLIREKLLEALDEAGLYPLLKNDVYRGGQVREVGYLEEVMIENSFCSVNESEEVAEFVLEVIRSKYQ